MNERRKHKRYPIAYPIEYKNNSISGKLALMDVSKAGVAFTTAEKLTKDDEIDLHLFMKRKRFHLQARVVHAMTRDNEHCSIGAKFINVPEDFIKKLEEEIAEIETLHRQSNLPHGKKLSFEKVSINYLKRSFLSR